MGGRVRIVVYARTEAAAERACTAAFARFAELDAIMSDYRVDSELMRLCARAGQGPVAVSGELFHVLELSQRLARLSGGAFDVTCGPLVALWREARKVGQLPDPEKMAAAQALVGYCKMHLDAAARTVELEQPGMRLDLGGIAKGYACDEAIRVLKEHGIDRALVEAGGDIAASGPPPGRGGWSIAVRGMAQPFTLANGGLSTSGDTEQFVEIGGVRYSHVLDPRTGLGLTNPIQVTVLARDATTSDSLATALCVLGEREGRPLAARHRAQAFFLLP
jgi:FAD:protein FMN transferase